MDQLTDSLCHPLSHNDSMAESDLKNLKQNKQQQKHVRCRMCNCRIKSALQVVTLSQISRNITKDMTSVSSMSFRFSYTSGSFACGWLLPRFGHLWALGSTKSSGYCFCYYYNRGCTPVGWACQYTEALTDLSQGSSVTAVKISARWRLTL